MNSDYELYLNYKSTKNPQVLQEFFKRYEKLIIKVYSSYLRKFSWYYSLEDFKQDAFILLYKALNYIKEEVIYDKYNWKLYTIYKMYLTNKAEAIIKRIKTFNKNNSFMDSEVISYIENKSNENKLIEYELVIDSFMKKLTPIEQKIFYMKNVSYEFYTFDEISKELKIPLSTVANKNKILIEKFKRFYK